MVLKWRVETRSAYNPPDRLGNRVKGLRRDSLFKYTIYVSVFFSSLYRSSDRKRFRSKEQLKY